MKYLFWDTEYNQLERFNGEEEFCIVDEEHTRIYPDNHSHPESLLCFEEQYLRVLELISYKNYGNGIKKIVEREYDCNYSEIIKNLTEMRLIIYRGINWLNGFLEEIYELSPKAKNLIGIKE